ncbi:putative acid--amine ligase YgiC [Syntrophobacter sp. SbD1]|nr:putative acid--amine ligase YgiC [Syntrophobacter sp. SbD1]
MQRIKIQPRENWQSKVEASGLLYHHNADSVYWNESAYYLFSSEQIDVLDDAANDLHQLALKAVQHVIDNNRFAEIGIVEEAVPLIRKSWAKKELSLYGRFDFAYDGVNPPKLLEYNADTPTALLEASVIQWYWLQEVFGEHSDQFNSIHEKLLEFWPKIARQWGDDGALYLTCVADSLEDLVTVTYLMDTAVDAGIKAELIFIGDIGLGLEPFTRFTTLDDITIENIFKLYPWEWLLADKYGKYVAETFDRMTWIEPIWKLILSSKGILPVLWELNPGHPNLLEAYFEGPERMKEFVRKPLLSREGANVTVYRQGEEVFHTSGTYGEEGYIYQALAPLAGIDGNYPVLGCWVIGGHSAGMGVRESQTIVTNNLSPFVPHRFE